MIRDLTNITTCINQTSGLVFNTSMMGTPLMPGEKVSLTYNDLISQYSAAFLGTLLTTSIFILIAELYYMWYIKDMMYELPAFWRMDWNNKKLVRQKIFCFFVLVSFVPTAFLPIIIIIYKLGYNL